MIINKSTLSVFFAVSCESVMSEKCGNGKVNACSTNQGINSHVYLSFNDDDCKKKLSDKAFCCPTGKLQPKDSMPINKATALGCGPR
ncbi:hypothetical protein Pst134EA_025740 [Puccinia striiformis f. sp. tritici]|uniref:hypothetical protein n=1 Tax=Puccinia striiformis f. sp. tritici TaxID=168172 RepID=UPI0020086A48|nr:hypothetical protein Pst134EA_025740 [Puccinia striiformis f. sp. tritici]KAH9451802.1 hypothetical protein Pst134EA_025740 [Puccinia striiformis f. sp. tritici]KAI9618453.1 hypothetical protein H4Q26_012274 [Puccinia striiformis f. sp. tritici PST-130]